MVLQVVSMKHLKTPNCHVPHNRVPFPAFFIRVVIAATSSLARQVGWLDGKDHDVLRLNLHLRPQGPQKVLVVEYHKLVGENVLKLNDYSIVAHFASYQGNGDSDRRI